LSFSTGTSVLIPPSAPSLADLIGRADCELYRAKRAERRPVVEWLPHVAAPAPVPVPVAAA
jgi:hypothetical protein